MRTFETRCRITLALLVAVASGCGDPADSGYEPIRSSRQAATTIIVAGTSMDDVQDALDQAVAGDTIRFPEGEYQLDASFRFKSDVAFTGDGPELSILSGVDQNATLRFEHIDVENVTISHLTFKRIGLVFVGSNSNFGESSNVYLKNPTFKEGKGDGFDGQGYVSLKYTDGVVVDGCTFLRAAGEGGRGVRSWPARSTIIKDSFIGTTKHLAMGAPDGYYKNAVNIGGSYDNEVSPLNQNIKIHNTVIRRALDGCDACEDHGIYAVYYDGLELTQNRIDGWLEYSAKLRNSESSFVFGNHFRTSGIYLHPDHLNIRGPEYVRQVHVRDNRFEMSGCDAPNYCGIKSWRDADLPDENDGYERDIYLRDNTFVNGGVIRLVSVDATEFCVENNPGATLDFASASGEVRTTGCSPDSWDRPLAGVFTGDFNDDSIDDTATRVPGTSGWTWRVYLSKGPRYRMLDFGDGSWSDVDTELYGVHVGDFNGDQKDDIIYRGRCGSGDPCWRVQASNGTSFVTKTGFGDGMFSSDETLKFGVHVGDFDGDGLKDDLVYRGKCGSPGVPCWRVHKGNISTFTVHNFGDSASWYEKDSEIYGLLIGNFDGDAAGKDDIAYVGKCGSSRCIRVHLSTGSAFVYQSNWGQGAGILRDGPEITEHFGMQVGDLPPKDGKADIGYRGRCGSSSRWRYHKTNASGTGFDIVCTDTNDF